MGLKFVDMFRIANKQKQMKDIHELTPEEKEIYDAMVDKVMEPFEERGIVRKVKRGKYDFWATTVNPAKLKEAVDRAIAKKEGRTGRTMINGSEVILSAGIFFLQLLHEGDRNTQQALDDYMKELDS